VALLGAAALAEETVRPKMRPAGIVEQGQPSVPQIRPQARREALPRARWWRLPGSDVWTRAAESALLEHGAALPAATPQDIATWCPAYLDADPADRRAFWVGLLSTLAKHESTYRPRVSGDSGRSHGLLQIRVSTARAYGCRAQSQSALLVPAENLSCAIRIMSRTVTRDNAVALSAGRRAGVAADWGPFSSPRKREDMRSWLRAQTYCTPLSATRPRMRPSQD